MKRHRFSPGSRGLKGFSLIELMVSLAIGLIITIAAFSAYLGASTASRMAEAQARMNEDAQAALSILTQQFRMAGNNPERANRIGSHDPMLSSRRNPIYTSTYAGLAPLTQTNRGSSVITPFTPSAFSIRGCDGIFSNLTTAARLDDLNCVSDTSQPDSIAISYEADEFNTIGTVPTNTIPTLPTDCLGNRLRDIKATLPEFNPLALVVPPVATPSAVPYWMADNRFYIGTSRTIVSPSLYCKGNGGGPGALQQPLVENIEDMQFTYGTINAATAPEEVKTAPVAGYLSATQIDTNVALASLPNDGARWSKVITVRICVLVRSESPVVSDSASASYLKCDGSVSAAQPDLRLRRAYSTTVVLRNRKL